MDKIAFYIIPPEITYFSAIITKLPPELVDIHIGPINATVRNLDFLNNNEKKHVDYLQSSNYNVYPLNADIISKYGCVAVSSMFMSPYQHVIKWYQHQQGNYVYLLHSAGHNCRAGDSPSSFYLMAHQRQAETPDINKFTKRNSPELFKAIMALPHRMRNEFSVSGLYHLGEWKKKRNTSKEKLKGELEDNLGITLNPHKPVVFFIQAHHHHCQQLKIGLQKLAEHVVLIVKPHIQPLEIPSAIMWKDTSYAPNLPRFAADFILTGYHSGTLVSSSMLGLKAIPYYTSLMNKNYPWERKSITSHKVYNKNQKESGSITCDILSNLNPPIDITNTEAILQRMLDNAWWDDYNAKLPGAQNKIFGSYAIEDAPGIAAKLLLRVLFRGTFGDAALAVQPRLEYAEKVTNLLKGWSQTRDSPRPTQRY